MKFYVLAVLLLTSFLSSAQASVLNKKGKWSAYYGYNRAEYSKSDYHVNGNGYDFTLKGVEADDSPTPFRFDPYLVPWGISVPQNNTRFSYFLTDTFAVSFGSDHMKYRMNDYQTVGFEGTISGTGTSYDGHSGDTIDIEPDLLSFEHTDGLNYVSLEFEQFKSLWLNDKGDQAISVYWGPGIAIMFPKTNAQIFGKKRHDEFLFSGYGYSVKFGAEYLYDEWFLRLGVKYGHINMTDAKISPDYSEYIAHEFDFFQTFSVVGIYF